jgi:nitroimidazol reductase NimA-like FMN-containing flavoprotein (pyridoxamine 5'-phosphate oxidase superfamily)
LKAPFSGGRDDVLEILDEHQCLEYLHANSLGRVAFTTGDELDIFPVNYACDGAIVVYRTAQGSRLERGPRDRVAFEVDGWDSKQLMGWSVVLKGVALDVTSGRDPFSKALRDRHVVPLAPGRRERWIAIYPAVMTGRRFRVSPEQSRRAQGFRP